MCVSGWLVRRELCRRVIHCRVLEYRQQCVIYHHPANNDQSLPSVRERVKYAHSLCLGIVDDSRHWIHLLSFYTFPGRTIARRDRHSLGGTGRLGVVHTGDGGNVNLPALVHATPLLLLYARKYSTVDVGVSCQARNESQRLICHIGPVNCLFDY